MFTTALCGVPAVAVMLAGAATAASAAALKLTLFDPEVITQLTVSVWPQPPAR